MLIERFQGTEFEQIVFQVQASAIEQDLDDDAARARTSAQIQLALRIKRMHEEIESAEPGRRQPIRRCARN